MSEPNIFVKEGDTVMIRATVIDAHWADKQLYKVRLTQAKLSTHDAKTIEIWVHDRQLRMPEQP